MKALYATVIVDGVDLAIWDINGVPSVFYNEASEEKAKELIESIYKFEGVQI